MNELGQSMLGNSVIHTAPWCHSVLYCESVDEHYPMLGPMQTPSPRLSGPEEQWEDTAKNRWSNQQHEQCSFFPYRESKPVDSFDDSINEAQYRDDGSGTAATPSGRPSIVESDTNIPVIQHTRLGDSQQSQLSR